MYKKAGTGGNMKEYLKPEVIVLDKKKYACRFFVGRRNLFFGL